MLQSPKQPKERGIESLFARFHHAFDYMQIEELISYFACFGGVEERVRFDFFEDLPQSVERIFVREYRRSREWIRPSYLLESPRRELLMATARSDGKMLNIFKRARINETVGGRLMGELERLGTVRIEESREAVPRAGKGMALPRELRRYRVQPKVRFLRPFDRFWFTFVEPHRSRLEAGEGAGEVLKEYRMHRDRVESLVFEQLSNDLLVRRFADSDPVLSKGSHWNIHSEFDILCRTRSGRIILGECKFTGRRVCRNELTKLREKAEQSGIRADYLALFSRSGFSRELLESAEEGLLLFDLEAFRSLF